MLKSSLNKKLLVLFAIIITLIQNGNTSKSTKYLSKNKTISHFQRRNVLTSKSSTLDVIYMVPGELDDVFNLNEKETFGNGYYKGWLLPSNKYLTLTLYLYYDGLDQRRLNLIFNQANLFDTNKSNNNNVNSSIQSSSALVAPNENNNNLPSSKVTLYMFFTPENHCKDFMKRNSWAVEITEQIASNMFKAKLNSIILAYSSKPYYICMQQFDSDDNIQDSFRDYSHQGDDYWITIVTTRDLMPTWARIVLFTLLLCLSGLFSGLNLGLMSLDLSELDILKRIGTPKEQSYVEKIYPLRKKGNFLLCTILLGNVLVNAVSTLILGEMLSGIYAAFGSTLLIVIFGEIIPQAACSKHGLAVGAYTRYITYLFMVLTCPLSYPISKILDLILGQEISATYNRDKIRELMRNIDDLGEKEMKIISGALDFNKKKVKNVMTKLTDVFMLEKNSKLDFETIAKIAQEGYSRIPIYEGTRDNVVGLLHVKDFTLLDPDDNMPVNALLEFYNHKVCFCEADKPIDEMFEEFRKGETHLAFVTDVVQPLDKDPYDQCIGIVTLEDILEELVQMEIYDEFDNKEDIIKEMEMEKLEKTKAKQKEIDDLAAVNKTRSGSKRTSLEKSSSVSKSNDLELEKLNNDYQVNGDVNQKARESINETNSKSNNSNDSNNNSSNTNKSMFKQNALKMRYDTQTSYDLTFFLQQQKDSSQRNLISPQIRFVMFQFLFTTVRPFTSEFLTRNVLELIFKRTQLKETRRLDQKSPCEYLYHYGKGCNYFILILSGEATIEVGKEKLEFPAGPFAYFGVNALLCGCENVEQVLADDVSLVNQTEDKKSHSKLYIPDFSLRVDDRCVFIKIDRDLWRNGVIKSRLEIQNNQMSDTIDLIANNNEQLLPNTNNKLPEDDYVVDLPANLSKFHSLSNRNLGNIINDNNQKIRTFSNIHTRRSTLTIDALNKVQEVAKSRANSPRKDNNLNTNNDSKNQSDIANSVNNLSDITYSNTNSKLDNKTKDYETNSMSTDINSETEPFLKKNHSTASLHSRLNKNKNLNDNIKTDKYQTLSEKDLI